MAAQAGDRPAERPDPRPHRRRRPGLRPGHRRARRARTTSSRATARLTVAAPGRSLRRIYGERDLLVAECLRRGTWDGLDAPALAALACCLVYEPRREEADAGERGIPRGAVPRRARGDRGDLVATDDLEEEHRLPRSEPPSAGLALATQRWASRRGARQRAARGRPRGRRLRALDEAGDRPARPDLDRRRRRARPHRPRVDRRHPARHRRLQSSVA